MSCDGTVSCVWRVIVNFANSIWELVVIVYALALIALVVGFIISSIQSIRREGVSRYIRRLLPITSMSPEDWGGLVLTLVFIGAGVAAYRLLPPSIFASIEAAYNGVSNILGALFIVVFAVGAVVAVIFATVERVLWRWRQRKQQQELEDGLSALVNQTPELEAAVQLIRRSLKAEGRQSFWVNVALNLFIALVTFWGTVLWETLRK